MFFLGKTRIGLLETCFTIYGRESTCEASVLPAEWTFSLVLLVLGILTSTITSMLFVTSQWKPGLTNVARWIGFAGSKSSIVRLVMYVHVVGCAFQSVRVDVVPCRVRGCNAHRLRQPPGDIKSYCAVLLRLQWSFSAWLRWHSLWDFPWTPLEEIHSSCRTAFRWACRTFCSFWRCGWLLYPSCWQEKSAYLTSADLFSARSL